MGANVSNAGMVTAPRLLLLIIIFISFSPALVSADPDRLDGLSDDDMKKLEQGEVVLLIEPEEDNPGRIISAAFIIRQPIDKSWELLRQPERQGRVYRKVG